MIAKKYYAVVFSGVMAIMMGLFMSGIVTAINTGFDANYINRWMTAFPVVVPIAFVCMQFLRPLATMITVALTDSNGEGGK